MPENPPSAPDTAAEHGQNPQSATPSSGRRTSKAVSGWRFAGGAVLGVAAFAGILIALGARLENPDLTPPAASAEELARQDLAEQAVRIENSARQLQQASPDSAALASIAQAAAVYSDTLGGVWIPWPDGAPTGYTNPPVATAPPQDLDGAALTAQLLTFSGAALEHAEAAPSEQRRDLESMALGSQFLAMNLAEAEKLPSPPTCADVDVAAAGLAANSPAMLETADAARQWLETDAANLAQDKRADELVRIDALSSFEEAILGSGTADTRTAFAAYPELGEGDTYTSQALRLLNAELLQSAAQAPASERDVILSFTCSLHLTAAERSAALPLPGLLQP